MTRPSKYDQLLDAAEKVVRRDGSARLTLDAVAAEASVSKGGLLYHFPSKEALLTAMVQRMVRSFDDARDRVAGSDDDAPGAWTRAYVRTTAGSGSPSEHDTTSSALLAAIALEPSLVTPLRERYVHWRARIADDGIDGIDGAVACLAADGLWMADLLGLAPPQGEVREEIVFRMLELAGERS
jgi:AcrR family transcriptional regulator